MHSKTDAQHGTAPWTHLGGSLEVGVTLTEVLHAAHKVLGEGAVSRADGLQKVQHDHLLLLIHCGEVDEGALVADEW